MSMCICFHNDNALIIAADTAVTMNRNNELFRMRNHTRKLFEIDRFLVFTSGSKDIADIIIRTFRKEPNKSAEKLCFIVKECVKNFKINYPEMFERYDENNKGAGILAAEYTDEGVLVHIMQPEDGFTLHTHCAPSDGTIHHTAGYFADEALSYVGDLAMKQNLSVAQMVDNTFSHFSGGEVGGSITVAMLDKDGIKFFAERPINEKLQFRIYEDVFFCEIGMAHFVGSHIKTATNGRRIELEENGFKTYDSNNRNRIKINTGNDDEVSAITFFGSNGAFVGEINSLGNQERMNIVSNDLFIGSNSMSNPIYFQGRTTFNGNVEFQQGVRGLTIDSISGLNAQLDSMKNRISEIEQKLYSHTHSVDIGTHNHGNKDNHNWGGTFTTSRP